MPLKPTVAGCASAAKVFHVPLGSLNTFRWVDCFQPEIPTGLLFGTFAAGLLYWGNKYKRAALHCASPGMFYFCQNRTVTKPTVGSQDVA